MEYRERHAIKLNAGEVQLLSSDVSRPISAGTLISRLLLSSNHSSDVSCPISAGTLIS